MILKSKRNFSRQTVMRKLFALLLLAIAVDHSYALNNGLALTPPMGWLSWERFRCETDCNKYPDSCISEQLYMRQADLLVTLGLRDLGYVYVNIDDCWPAPNRDPNTGRLVPDPQRFPHGIPFLVDYMHQRGLKLGIYEDFGSKTCAGYPGSEFYMQTDAQTFADWRVDSLKFDGCNADPGDMKYGFPVMQRFMNMTGHPMVFSCEWPLYEWAHKMKSNFSAIRESCNLWRSYTDVTDSWDSVSDIISYWGNNPQNMSNFAGPGGFSDPDMLVIGNFGLSHAQEQVQFGIFAMIAAPLLMSNDLRSISDESLSVLRNKEVIAINQDPLGIQGQMIFGLHNSVSVWMKPLLGGNTALAILNQDTYGGREQSFQIHLSDYGLRNPAGYQARELFAGKNYGIIQPSQLWEVFINPTSILLFKLVPQ